jgi:molybdenum cofactor cytidylyltransferase
VAETAVVVLAAGRGERLGGQAKAALRLPDRRSFVAAVVAAARSGGAGRVVVVAAAPYLDATRAAADAAGVDAVVVNDAPERGMASSFARGLEVVAECDAVLCWPVDHPTVRAQTVTDVLAVPAPVVVPVFAGRGGHPTLFRREVFAACRAAVHAPDGLRAVLRQVGDRVVRLAVDDPGVIRDIDTLDDWAELGHDDE